MWIICIFSWIMALFLFLRDVLQRGKQGKAPFFERIARAIVSFSVSSKLYREEVSRHLRLLYPTKDPKVLRREYYQKKLVLILKIWTVGIHLIALLSVSESMQSLLKEGRYLQRGTLGTSQEQVYFTVAGKNQSETEVVYSLAAQKYTPEEIAQYQNRFLQEYETLIRGENVNLQEVRSPLLLSESYKGYPLQFSWESSDIPLIDESGNVENENLKEKQSVQLTATMVYEEKKAEYSFTVCVCPKIKTEKETWEYEVLEAVRKADEDQKYSDRLILPDHIAGEEVSYSIRKESSEGIYLLFLVVIITALYMAKDRDLKKETLQRNRRMSLKYPEFVSKFQLLVGAGMTVRNVLIRLSEDDLLGKDLTQELKLFVRDMKNGVSVQDALDRFGQRCACPLYIKFSALLAQNLKKGTGDLLQMLSAETEEAFALRKNHARQLGEEAGTKLLLPMILMLAVVMIVLMIPAFLSFQL